LPVPEHPNGSAESTTEIDCQYPAGGLLALDGIEVRPLDEELGRRAGVLLERAGTSDVVDAALVLLAEDGDEIITSDPGALKELTRQANLDVELFRA